MRKIWKGIKEAFKDSIKESHSDGGWSKYAEWGAKKKVNTERVNIWAEDEQEKNAIELEKYAVEQAQVKKAKEILNKIQETQKTIKENKDAIDYIGIVCFGDKNDLNSKYQMAMRKDFLYENYLRLKLLQNNPPIDPDNTDSYSEEEWSIFHETDKQNHQEHGSLLQEAMRLLNEVTRREPEYIDAWEVKSIILFYHLDRYTDALDSINRVIHLDPKNDRCLDLKNKILNVLKISQNYPNAGGEYQTYLQKSDSQPKIYSPSKSEDRLFDALISQGLNPKRQYGIDQMKVDFAFPREKVVIEVDGAHHRNQETSKQDHERDRILQEDGWKVYRVNAEEVWQDANKVAYKIKKFLEKYQ